MADKVAGECASEPPKLQDLKGASHEQKRQEWILEEKYEELKALGQAAVCKSDSVKYDRPSTGLQTCKIAN